MNLELKDIYVSYTHKNVLNGVNIFFMEGKIHGLLGENGAGKSTLANIISGELKPSSGTILINNTKVQFKNAKSAIHNGICYVHQTPMLAKELSIKENLLLGLINKDSSFLLEISSKWLTGLSLKTLVKNVGADTRFFIALSCALLKKPSFLILDEPSALLDDFQRDFLYSELQKLAKIGMNILVITHNIQEAEKYCDTITYLENGFVKDYNLLKKDLFPDYAKIKTDDKKNEINSEKKYDEKNEISNNNHLTFSVNKLTVRPSSKPAVFDLNFYVNQNEIVLINGLPEDGLSTLEDVITGMNTKHSSGFITISDYFNKKILFSCNLQKDKFTTSILRKSIVKTGIIPTDRIYRGSNPNLKISDVITVGHKNANNTISNEDAKLLPKKIIKLSNINISENEPAKNLSGGMLQRIIINRELVENPDLLILCQPLQGLDIQTCEEICQKIKLAANNGAMVLILSSNKALQNISNRCYELTGGHLKEIHKTEETA